MTPRSPIRRINVMIAEHQYETLTNAGVNISGLIRNLIEDHISKHVVALSVSERTHDMYTKVVANSGATDADIEPLFVEALKKVLAARVEKIKNLQNELGK